jgi:HlyD family secretion protein
VELDINQNDFAKVAPRQPCWIVTDAYPDKKYKGAVDLISPEANRQKATVQVRVKVLDPDDLLKPDMNATVSFLSAQRTSATQGAVAASDRAPIRVPATAVRDGAVFVVENGKAIKRTVAISRSSGRDVEVRTGLIGGEDLIVSPPESLQDGARVRPQEKM